MQMAKLPSDAWEAMEKGREKERRHAARDLMQLATKEVPPVSICDAGFSPSVFFLSLFSCSGFSLSVTLELPLLPCPSSPANRKRS